MEPQKSLFSVDRMMGASVVKFLPPQILDQVQIADISHDLQALIDQGATKLVLDFSNVNHLSSGTLGMLINLKKQVEAKKGQVRLCALKPTLFEVFKITRLDKVFSFHATADEALLSLK